MKYLFLLSFAILFHGSTIAQCEVDAGEDIVACLTNAQRDDAINLDGQIVSGNVEKIEWSAMRLSDGNYITDQLLQDSTILNPKVDLFGIFDIVLSLKGTMINNETCTDSTIVRISSWGYLPTENAACKAPADTISLWSTAIPALPASYAWSPNFMISDTTLEFPEVWNDTTIVYTLTITDTLGCVEYTDPFESFVKTSSLNQETSGSQLHTYPNPTQGNLLVTLPESGNYNYTVTSESGRLILSGTSDHISELELDMSHVESGMYLLQLTTDEQSYVTKVVVAH